MSVKSIWTVFFSLSLMNVIKYNATTGQPVLKSKLPEISWYHTEKREIRPIECISFIFIISLYFKATARSLA